MSETTHKLRISTRIAKCTNSESSRYALGSVNVTPRADGGAWLCATDGRALAVTSDAGATAPTPTAIPGAILATVPKRGLILECSGQWKVSNGKFAPLDEPGRFPAVDQAFPLDVKGDYIAGDRIAVRLDADLLHNLAQAVTALDGDRRGVTLLLKTTRDKEGYSSSPIVVVGTDGVGLLMPLAGDGAERDAERFDSTAAAFAVDFKAARNS